MLSLLTFEISAQEIRISKKQLQDKIKGGWAGQTIGVTFGGPYEFRFQGSFIGDDQPLKWNDTYLVKNMLESPGLYDDLYMDLTFVDVFEKYGLDAPLDSFSNAYAHAGYMLWHANQAGRYNILHGLKAPASGYWVNNPHADCIDYQIESDFAGLMSPGMPNVASSISDKIGHIMNYGDGWYGGVFVGAMYSLAFIHNDVKTVIKEALNVIPQNTKFNACIADVIRWHQLYPNDWKMTWLEVQKKWANDVGCPDGVHNAFNIDATVNAAYVVMGLLYGNGDFTNTLEIATRCGQDADCNPSSAAGILGTILGYDHIPGYWKQGLGKAEDIDFKYTTMSLNDVYKIGYKHAIENIIRNGGVERAEEMIVRTEKLKTVQWEQSFEKHYPQYILPLSYKKGQDTYSFEFDGNGFVIKGGTADNDTDTNDKVWVELTLDGEKVEMIELPVNFTKRRHEIAWKYGLPEGKHKVLLKIVNETLHLPLFFNGVIIYADKPSGGILSQKQLEKGFKQ
ncbi:MAG: ADP-ribosylglycohydrolase family protein [Chitinophagaceae bacterium]